MKIGIITDIHEDAERLYKAMQELEKRNCNDVYCLGDISGFDERFYSYKYSRNLTYCLQVIESNCRAIIPGNHDLNQLKKLPKNNNVFFFPDNWYYLPFKKRKELSNGLIWLYENDIPVKNISYFQEVIGDFQDQIIIEQDGIRIFLSHAIFPDISGFLTRKPIKINDYHSHLEHLKHSNCHIGISGHLHPNGLLKIDYNKIHNPKFSEIEINIEQTTQFVSPCIADGIQDNGFTIIDTINRTIEAIPLRTPRFHSYLS